MKAKTLNFHWVMKKFENLRFLELWSAGKYRWRISRCQKDVANCQITGWRPFFIKISEFVYLDKINLVWTCLVICMLQNEIMAPRLPDDSSYRCWNDAIWRFMTPWRQIFEKITGIISHINILLVWTSQVDWSIKSEVIAVFIFA